MRSSTTIFLTWIILSSCSTNKLESNKESYIKVIISGDAHKPTAYNKGLGAHYYFYFNLSTDSLFYLYPEFKENNDNIYLTYVNHAFEGKLDNEQFRDTMMQLVQSLEWRPSGSTDSISEDAIYCGWEYYVEFPAKNIVKYYSVTSGISDTLDNFFEFFRRLEYSSWAKHPTNPKAANIDNEIVSAMKRFGTYENRKIPYLFPECDSGIDFTKLTGRWRTVDDHYHSTRKDRFILHTFRPDSTFSIESFVDGKFKSLLKGVYSIDISAGRIFYTSSEKLKMTYTLTQLTDSCLSGIQTNKGRNSKTQFNKL